MENKRNNEFYYKKSILIDYKTFYILIHKKIETNVFYFYITIHLLKSMVMQFLMDRFLCEPFGNSFTGEQTLKTFGFHKMAAEWDEQEIFLIN